MGEEPTRRGASADGARTTMIAVWCLGVGVGAMESRALAQAPLPLSGASTASTTAASTLTSSAAATSLESPTEVAPPGETTPQAEGEWTPPEDLGALVELLSTPIEVWTASRMKESLRDAAAVIDVVTASDIAAFGYRSVGEALGHLQGFYMLDDHTIPNIAVRGVSGGLAADSSIIKLMIDGHAVAFRATSGAWLGAELIPISAVERIEVVRGPASATYGADAFLGVVNVITRKSQRPELDLRGAAVRTGRNWGGSYDAYAGHQLGNFELALSAAGEYTDRSGMGLPSSSPAPIVPLYNADRPRGRDLQHRSNSFFAKASYTPDTSPLRLLRVEGLFSDLRRGGDFSRWSQLSYTADRVPGGARTLIALFQYQVALHAEITLAESLDLTANVAHFGGGPADQDRIEVASELFYVEREFSFRGLNGDLEVSWEVFEGLVLASGAEYLLDVEEMESPTRILRATGVAIEDERRRDTRNIGNLGVFARGQWKPFDDDPLKIAAGLRYDHHSIYGSELSGRAAVTWNLEERLFLKVLYGSAFKAPSPLFLYATPLAPGDLLGNPDLEPQRVHTFEVKGSHVFSKNFELSSGLAYSLLFDKAEFVPRGINRVAENIAELRALSFENRLDVMFPDWKVYASFDWQISTTERGEENYQNVLVGSAEVLYPKWIGRAGGLARLSLSGDLRLSLGGEASFVGARRASETNILENAGSYSLPAYATFNASVGLEDLETPWSHASIYLRAYNLTDTRTADPGFNGFDYPRTPRELWLEARLKF